MRNLKYVGFGLALLGLVAFNYRIALAQYRSGPSDLARGLGIGSAINTNLIPRDVRFPVSATNVDLTVSFYNSNNTDANSITVTLQKSMDSLVWSNALVFTTPTSPTVNGGRLYHVTNASVGNYGWVRVSAITNLGDGSITNVQVIATHK